MRWETESPFDGQLCQEYSCQKSLKSVNTFKIDNVGVPFLRHSVPYIRLLLGCVTCDHFALQGKSGEFCIVFV